jgi:hypothetical protein
MSKTAGLLGPGDRNSRLIKARRPKRKNAFEREAGTRCFGQGEQNSRMLEARRQGQ